MEVSLRVSEIVLWSLVQGQKHAHSAGSVSVDPEHMLVGLLRASHGNALAALSALGIDGRKMCGELSGEDGVRVDTEHPPHTMPQSNATKAVIQHAAQEARACGGNIIGSDHLLLGILAVESPASAMLARYGVNQENVRQALRKIEARPEPPRGQPEAEAPAHAPAIAPAKPRRRLRWWRWAGVALLFVALSYLWSLCERYMARQQLNAAVAARAAHGEPVLPADFPVRPVPDDQNAAFFLRRAMSHAELTGADETVLDEILKFESSPSPSDLYLMGEIIDRHKLAFDDLAQAQRCGQIAWGVRPDQMVLTGNLEQLNGAKTLTMFLAAAARYAHLQHQDAAAVERVRWMLLVNRSVDREGPVTAHLVAIGVCALASQCVREMALEFDPAQSEGLRTLMGAFLIDDEQRKAGITETLLRERATILATTQQAANAGFWTRTVFDRAGVLMMADVDALRTACLAPDYPAAKRLLPAVTPGDDDARVVKIRQIFAKTGPLVCQCEFRGLTERRVAATALALRLYALDHGGTLPEKLAELVPTYLPVLPPDPFATDGRPLGYQRQPHAALYSVGENGVDDGMDDKLPGRTNTSNPWQSPDAVFYLRRP